MELREESTHHSGQKRSPLPCGSNEEYLTEYGYTALKETQLKRRSSEHPACSQHNTSHYKDTFTNMRHIPHHHIPKSREEQTALTNRPVEQQNISRDNADQYQHDYANNPSQTTPSFTSTEPEPDESSLYIDNIRITPTPLFLAQVHTPAYNRQQNAEFFGPRYFYNNCADPQDRALHLRSSTLWSIQRSGTSLCCSHTRCSAARRILTGIGSQFEGDLSLYYPPQLCLDEGCERK